MLELCDGERSAEDIAAALSERYGGADVADDVRELLGGMDAEADWWSMPAPRPYTLVAELSYQCPLHCPYCSNPVDIGGERYRDRARDRALDPRLPRGAARSASSSSR